MAGFNNPTFDLFMLSDEHNERRAVLRDLCEQEIAPYAAGQRVLCGRRRCVVAAFEAGAADGIESIHTADDPEEIDTRLDAAHSNAQKGCPTRP
jgi:hypothetical protein